MADPACRSAIAVATPPKAITRDLTSIASPGYDPSYCIDTYRAAVKAESTLASGLSKALSSYKELAQLVTPAVRPLSRDAVRSLLDWESSKSEVTSKAMENGVSYIDLGSLIAADKAPLINLYNSIMATYLRNVEKEDARIIDVGRKLISKMGATRSR